MILEIMSHPSFGINAQLLCADCLAVLFHRYRDLPRSTSCEVNRTVA
jgi:hypothetical protein